MICVIGCGMYHISCIDYRTYDDWLYCFNLCIYYMYIYIYIYADTCYCVWMDLIAFHVFHIFVRSSSIFIEFPDSLFLVSHAHLHAKQGGLKSPISPSPISPSPIPPFPIPPWENEPMGGAMGKHWRDIRRGRK